MYMKKILSGINIVYNFINAIIRREEKLADAQRIDGKTPVKDKKKGIFLGLSSVFLAISAVFSAAAVFVRKKK